MELTYELSSDAEYVTQLSVRIEINGKFYKWVIIEPLHGRLLVASSVQHIRLSSTVWGYSIKDADYNNTYTALVSYSKREDDDRYTLVIRQTIEYPVEQTLI